MVLPKEFKARYEHELEEARQHLRDLDEGRFRIYSRTLGSPEVEVTSDMQAHYRRVIEMYEMILARAI